MKKLFYLIALLPMLFACTEESSEGDIIIVKPETLPSTKVFVQGTLVDFTSTRADYDPNKDYGYGVGVWPSDHSDEGWAVAKFSIRIDASCPGVIDQPVNNYWTTKSKNAKNPRNLGKVDTNYPWGTYNDRDFDYYKVDQKSKNGENTGMFRYVLDPSGVQVEKALIEIPDMKAYCEWLLKRNDTQFKTQLQEIVDNWDDYQLVWYVAKEVGGQNFWHVNGYFREKSHTPDDILEIIEDETEDMEIKDNDVPDNVEIDIHKQEHKDWNEIKTSIHIRTDAETIKINIPIAEENIVEQDDFAIRVFNYYYKEYEVTHTITHDAEGITIEITNIDPTLISQLLQQYGDGLTVEIHSYCKKEDGVWEAMKQTTVETGKECNLKYQITSADPTENETMISYEYTVPVPEETGE